MKTGINPENCKQRRLFYCYQAADGQGETRHAQVVMRELAEKHSFKILCAIPQSLGRGWDFWIGFETAPNLPHYFNEGDWKPVGEY